MAADMAIVCDASVLAAMAFGDRDSDLARALTTSRRLYAPSLLRYELAQVALRRSGTAGDPSRVEKAFRSSLRVPVKLIQPAWPAVLDLARNSGLSAYDASYLQIAQALSIPLATLDKKLAGAAEALGLKARPRAD